MKMLNFKNDPVTLVSLILLIVGGLNWGLTAFGYNLVNLLFGSVPILEQIVYVLVALAAVVILTKMVAKTT